MGDERWGTRVAMIGVLPVGSWVVMMKGNKGGRGGWWRMDGELRVVVHVKMVW